MHAPATIYFLGTAVVLVGGWRIISSFGKDRTPQDSAPTVTAPASGVSVASPPIDERPQIMGHCGVGNARVRVYYLHSDGTSSAVTYDALQCDFNDDYGVAVIKGVECTILRPRPQSQDKEDPVDPIVLQKQVMSSAPDPVTPPSAQQSKDISSKNVKETLKQGFFRLPK